MIFCVLSLSRDDKSQNNESLEEILPKKLPGFLGKHLSNILIDDISKRALQNDFPSLVSDPYLAELSTIAMENSLCHHESPLKLSIDETQQVNKINTSRYSPRPPLPSSNNLPITITSSLPISTTTSSVSTISSVPSSPIPILKLPSQSQDKTFQNEISLGYNKSNPITTNTSVTTSLRLSISPSIQKSDDIYLPSWTSPDITSHVISPDHDIEGYSTTLDSPWPHIHSVTSDNSSEITIESNVDRTKLTSIRISVSISVSVSVEN
mmetsp:Transcript_21339/g.22063  ORF Transcript_21339/g.22063 Transcript_21339/m.22063 type:complete len:266 (+) Transcript_21339:724-1521(+)